MLRELIREATDPNTVAQAILVAIFAGCAMAAAYGFGG